MGSSITGEVTKYYYPGAQGLARCEVRILLKTEVAQVCWPWQSRDAPGQLPSGFKPQRDPFQSLEMLSNFRKQYSDRVLRVEEGFPGLEDAA